MAHFSQVHPGDDSQPSRQTLQQQADDGGTQQHPEELTGQDKLLRHHKEIQRYSHMIEESEASEEKKQKTV